MGTGTMAPALTAVEYDLVYNMISFGLASMGASTVFFFLRIGSFHERYKAALCFTGLLSNWHSIQRRLPLCGLAPYCSTSPHRDRARDEASRGRDCPALHRAWRLVCFDDHWRLPR